MKLFTGFNCVSQFKNGSVVTIGNFDGVHKGHQALISDLKQKALAKNLPLVILLFEPQPAEYFSAIKTQPRLQSLREKVAVLAKFGVDAIVRLKFNEHLANMRAEDFATTYLFQKLNSKYVMVGEDFRFGREREGDIDLLRMLSEKHGAKFSTFPNFY